MEKINGKAFVIYIFWILVTGLLVYSRFINLGWGLPYPMHPDERNMANAIQGLNCVISNLKECFNPHFFAYGQFPLYLGYLITFFIKLFKGNIKLPISFDEAALGIRTISALASIINAIIIAKTIKIITKKENQFLSFVSYLFIIFSPYAIQFAHFGTTESLLMMMYSAIIYYSLLFVDKEITTSSFVMKSALLIGISLATKVSAAIFLITPFLVLLFIKDQKYKSQVSNCKISLVFFLYKMVDKIVDLSIFIFLIFITFFVFSPHNFINFKEFVGSMNYESEVALGRSLVFYTRQFFDTTPIYFQLEKIFPYVFGWPAYVMGLIGIISLNWKNRKINLLRFAFLVYFIPSAMIYAKWSRFMAPIFPIITVFAILFLMKIRVINIIKIVIIIISILPGIAYLSIYQNQDVRFQASDWIYRNIPNNSYLLYETANVVDIPITDQRSRTKDLKENEKFYQTVSFNFYDLDENPSLQTELKDHINKADYIFIPSRRIFSNHPKQKYPILNKYYEDLFSGKLGLEKVAEFDSFPKICLPFTKKCFELPDENAEETWTVFDHPVIRIYKKISNLK